MTSLIQQRSVIDIKATVQAHQPIMPNLLAAYALSSCDAVSNYFGIGKSTAQKCLNAFPDSLWVALMLSFVMSLTSPQDLLVPATAAVSKRRQCPP